MNRFKINNNNNIGQYQYKDAQNLYVFYRYMCLQIGEYKYTGLSEDINGWLICDGRSLSRSTYKDLFDVIGTNFGSEDDLSFSLPDFRGRVAGVAGIGDGLTERSIGDVVGTETETLSSLQIPSHSHTGTVNSGGVHSHAGTIASDGVHNHSGSVASDGVHSHSASTNTTGSHLHAYNDAYFAENQGGAGGGKFGTSSGCDTDNSFYWRTAEGGYSTSASDINTSSSGNHSHTVTVDNSSSHTHGLTINNSTSHTHGITIDNSTSHTHTFTTGTTGSGQSHNNIQPTLFGGNMMIFGKFLPIEELIPYLEFV